MIRWLIVTSLAALAFGGPALAQDKYPSKVVRVVVPFAAGGSTDLLARNIAQKLNETWKQPVIVENKIGAGGIVGTEFVAKSAPDGYTLLVGTVTTHAANASLYAKLPYDPQRDFAAITEFASIPQLLSVHPSVPVRSLKELVEYAAARPGTLSYGSGGNGSASHMAMELLKAMTKAKMVHVPYKGTGPAMVDLLGGHISLMFDVVMTTLPHTQQGKLRTLAVSSFERIALLPNLPTVAESGYPEFEAQVWFGLFAPAGTPPEIVQKVQEDVARAITAPKMREELAAQGLQVVASSPADFSKRVASEIAKWREVIQGAGIKLD